MTTIKLEGTQVRERVTTVVAEAELNGRIFKGYGSSVCDPVDTPNSDTGFMLAVGRAVEELGHLIKKAGWAQVEVHPKNPPLTRRELDDFDKILAELKGRRAEIRDGRMDIFAPDPESLKVFKPPSQLEVDTALQDLRESMGMIERPNVQGPFITREPDPPRRDLFDRFRDWLTKDTSSGGGGW